MAKKRKKGAMYFTGVAAAGPDRALITGHYWIYEDTDQRITGALVLEGGKWNSLKAYTGIVHAARHDAAAAAGREFLLLERDRILYRVDASANFDPEEIDPSRDAFLMDLRRIGQSWFACGGQYQVFRFDGKKWTPIDDGLWQDNDDAHALMLQSIDGAGERAIHAVGTGGVIFFYDGANWRELDSPTNYDLERVLVVSESEIYLCGEGGALYRGDGTRWTALAEPDENLTFWDMARFADELYVCSSDALFVVRGDALSRVDLGVNGDTELYRLSAGEKDLWAIGGENVFQFDGAIWKRHDYPENA